MDHTLIGAVPRLLVTSRDRGQNQGTSALCLVAGVPGSLLLVEQVAQGALQPAEVLPHPGGVLATPGNDGDGEVDLRLEFGDPAPYIDVVELIHGIVPVLAMRVFDDEHVV